MGIVKRMVCLASSRKLNGRCVAGRELAAGQPAGWLRPVSQRAHEEVSEYERQYKDGQRPSCIGCHRHTATCSETKGVPAGELAARSGAPLGEGRSRNLERSPSTGGIPCPTVGERSPHVKRP